MTTEAVLPPELVCPHCLGALTPVGARHPLPAARCERCRRDYSADHGYLDFIGLPDTTTATPGDTPGKGGIGPRLMHSRVLAAVYEKLWRPAFITLASAGPPDYAEEFAAIQAALAPAAGQPIVDLSCGPGFTGRRLAATREFARVHGVDWSIAMLRQAVTAQHRAHAAPAQTMTLLRADVVHLPFARSSVAGVHAGAALHMWPDPQGAFAEVARVLRPGGVLVASTFVQPHPSLRPLLGAFQAVSGARVFETDELAGHCEAHGLVHFTARRRGALILFSTTRA
jgi:ubiquinone/menaquinone biosynthesis C-methylase UbiE